MRYFPLLAFALGFISLSACQPTTPVVEKATSNLIAISYDAYGSVPTITPEALDMAIEHCKKQGLFANYRGATVPNPLTTKEVHTFVCEKVKTNDGAVISAQNDHHAAASAASANAVDAFFEGYNASSPTYTSCTTVGFQTNCTSY